MFEGVFSTMFASWYYQAFRLVQMSRGGEISRAFSVELFGPGKISKPLEIFTCRYIVEIRQGGAARPKPQLLPQPNASTNHVEDLRIAGANSSQSSLRQF